MAPENTPCPACGSLEPDCTEACTVRQSLPRKDPVLQNHYIVVATIQSANGRPVDVTWYTGYSLSQAMAGMAQAAAHDEGSTVPRSIAARTLSVNLKIEEVPS